MERVLSNLLRHEEQPRIVRCIGRSWKSISSLLRLRHSSNQQSSTYQHQDYQFCMPGILRSYCKQQLVHYHLHFPTPEIHLFYCLFPLIWSVYSLQSESYSCNIRTFSKATARFFPRLLIVCNLKFFIVITLKLCTRCKPVL